MRVAAALLGAGLALLLVWSRSNELAYSFDNDEAFSAAFFIDHGMRAIFFHDGVPGAENPGSGGAGVLNNHRLFSLLAWGTTSVFGRSEPVYRFWSWLPGIAAVLLASAWAAVTIEPLVGWALCLIVVLVPEHAALTEQARGYGLGFLSAALVLIGGIRCQDRSDRLGPFLLALGGWLGISTLPVFVLLFLPQSILAAVASRRWSSLLAVVSVVGVLSAAFHGPMIRHLLLATGQDFGSPVPWSAVVDGAWRDIFRPMFEALFPGSDMMIPGSVFAALALGGAWYLACRGKSALVLAAVGPVVFAYGSFAASGIKTVPRFASFLLFHECLLPAAGVAAAIHAAAGMRQGPKWILSAGAAVLLVVILSRYVGWEIRSSSIPVEDYRTALETAYASGEPVYTNSMYGAGFAYYGAGRHGGDRAVRAPGADALEAMFCDLSKKFAYVHYPLYGAPVDLSCLLGRRHSEVFVPQRAGGPGGSMTVYVAAPSPSSRRPAEAG